MGAANQQATPVSYYIKLFICIMFLFFFNKLVPAWGGITDTGMASIGIFIGLVLMIVFNFGLIPSSLIAIFAVVHSGFLNGTDVIGQTIGNGSTVQLFFTFSICNSLIQTGAGAFIAKWMLSRRVIQGRPMVFCFVLLLAGWLSGPFMGSAGLVLIYTIMDYINDTLGYEKDSDFNMMTRIGLQSAGMIGMAFLPFKGVTLAIFTSIAGALESVGIETNYAYYMLGGAVIALLYCFAFLMAMRYLFRVDLGRLEALDITRMEGMSDLKITRPQVYSIVFSMAAILYTVVQLFLPRGAFQEYFSGITLWLWAALMMSVLALLRYKGKPVVEPEQMMEKIMWGVVLATAAPFCIEYCETLGVNGSFICLALISAAMFAFLTMAAAGPAPLLLSQEPFVKKPGYIWSHGLPVLVMGVLVIWTVSTVGAYVF